MCKSVRLCPIVSKTRQPQCPVWKLESERVPSFAMPAFSYSFPFKNDVLASAAAQIVAHGEAGLAATDYDRIVLLPHEELAPATDGRLTQFPPFGIRSMKLGSTKRQIIY